jgi:hypothetical protein
VLLGEVYIKPIPRRGELIDWRIQCLIGWVLGDLAMALLSRVVLNVSHLCGTIEVYLSVKLADYLCGPTNLAQTREDRPTTSQYSSFLRCLQEHVIYFPKDTSL